MSEIKIICSATFYDDGIERANMPLNIKTGIVACGLRHNNCIAILSECFPNRDYLGKHTHGFLTNKNEFVNRKEVAEIALAAGQITALKYYPNELDSSDLF